MKILLNRLLRQNPKVDHLHLTVYTRKECCCCHTAIEFLKGEQRKLRFAIDLVDVDADPELVAAYGLTVPVVAVDGKVRFKGVVNKLLWDRLLAAEDANKRSGN